MMLRPWQSSRLRCLGGIWRRHLPVAANRSIPDASDDNSSFKVGEEVHGFEVKHVTPIKEFKLTAVLLSHLKTKAEYLHLSRMDSNNLFSINFRTPPLTSTGLPHILEHMVLCGSQMFPVRDPFFKMLNRSLATYMNASTSPDYTTYPFSTQNEQDFRNLQKIYLDAVFQPKLNELDFLQEAWRLENTVPTDPKSPLIIKGVVYNEMKGAFAENENILIQKILNTILPDHTYAYVFGGDPLRIPELQLKDLQEFHAKYYHPSNSRFFSYGNFSLSQSLRYINDKYLCNYDYIQPSFSVVPHQVRWRETQQLDIKCRYENLGIPFDQQNTITISMLMSDVTDLYETLLFHLVIDLLVKGPNAPLYKSLVEPNFSGGFTPSTGFDTQPRDTVFTVGLQHIKKDNYQRFLGTFDETLKAVVDSGFKKEHIDSVLHNYELSLKHESGNFGLSMLYGLMSVWNHQGEVIQSLRINELLDKLRKSIQRPNYLQSIVQKYFVENKHRLVLTMSADKAYEEELLKAEKQITDKFVKGLSEKERKEIFERNQLLCKSQNTKEDLDNVLPTLTMNDIQADATHVSLEKLKLKDVPLQVTRVNTNGLLYFDCLLSSSDLSLEQEMLLPLFCYVITRMGTDRMDHRQLDSWVKRKTAGISASTFVQPSLYELHTYEPAIHIHSYCLEQNTDEMLAIWKDIFSISKMKDIDRFKMLMKTYMSNLTHGIADSGHLYAIQAAASLVSGSSYKNELLTGLQHISYMKQLRTTTNYTAIVEELLNIGQTVFRPKGMRSNLTFCSESIQLVAREFEKFITDISSAQTKDLNVKSPNATFKKSKVWSPTDTINCQHHIINLPLNFCSKAILTAPYAQQEHATLRVLAKLLTAKFLLPEVREKGGAYGAGAKMGKDGVLSLYSYRDPKSYETLDIFDSIYDWTKTKLDSLTDQELSEAKLGVFQEVDAPVAPGNRGGNEFFRRITRETLQRHRADVMSVNARKIQSVCDKYLAKADGMINGKVIIGPKCAQSKQNERPHELWTVLEAE